MFCGVIGLGRLLAEGADVTGQLRLPVFRALAAGGDPDVAWIVRENAKKARLAKLL